MLRLDLSPSRLLLFGIRRWFKCCSMPPMVSDSGDAAKVTPKKPVKKEEEQSKSQLKRRKHQQQERDADEEIKEYKGKK